jgi:hypothetical protein
LEIGTLLEMSKPKAFYPNIVKYCTRHPEGSIYPTKVEISSLRQKKLRTFMYRAGIFAITADLYRNNVKS